MTPLRQRMIDAMQLRGLAARTQQAYVGAVVGLARHYGCGPEQLEGAQVQEYLLHLVRQRQLSRSSVNQAGCAFRFLYHTVLERTQQVQVPLAKAEQRLPEILSRQELARLFECAGEGKPRTVLMTAYGLGLRVGELCRLRVCDIDGHTDRMCVRVVQGKGAKDRYVPLPPDVLQLLRGWWRCARPVEWMFCAQSEAAKPLCEDSASRWYHAARTRASIHKRGGIHTLRHCLPRTCWKQGLTCTACRSGWATVISAPPCATCIWRDPMHPTASGWRRWSCCAASPCTERRAWPRPWPKCCGASGLSICARTA